MDIAIRLDSSDGQPGLVTRKLMRFLWIICVPPGYLESTGEFASPADLTRRHQIGFRDAGMGLFMMCHSPTLTAAAACRTSPTTGS